MSSLATALPMVASPIAGEAGLASAGHQPLARAEAMPLRSVRPSPGLVVSPGGRGANAGPDISTHSRTELAGAVDSAEIDISSYQNMITVDKANISFARRSAAMSQGQDTGGGGSGGAALPADPLTKIRPMTLAASTESISSDGTFAAYDSSMSGIYGDVGSSSGSASVIGSGYSSASTSFSQSTIEYRAWITGEGKHPDDPAVSWDDSSGATPEKTQGEAWMSGGGTSVILRDAATGEQQFDWTLEQATWTLPSGMIKGYGEFSQQYERSDDPTDPGAYTTFSGDPVATADVMGFNADDLEYKDNTLERNDHVFDEAFFGADSTGEVTIAVNATFRNNNDPQKKVTKSDNVKLTINQPKGLMTRRLFGTAAGVAPSGNGGQILQFDKAFANNGNVGVLYESTVFDKTADGKALAPGIFKVVQTVDRTATREKTMDGVLVKEQHPLRPDKTPPGMVCDKDPYPGNLDDPNNPKASGTTTVQIGHKLYFNDSPGMTLSTDWDKYTVKDKLQATLMYKPDSAGRRGIYVPVEVVNWSWEGNALRQGAAFVDTANAAPTADATSSSTNQPPVYKQKINDFKNYIGNPKWIQTSP